MPIADHTPPVVRIPRPKHDTPAWQDLEHLLPKPDWMRRGPGDDAEGAASPSGPKPPPLAGAAEAGR